MLFLSVLILFSLGLRDEPLVVDPPPLELIGLVVFSSLVVDTLDYAALGLKQF